MNESATIEETVTRLVADVDWTDECEVLLHVRKRTVRLTPAQARQIASALTRSAEAAERAAASAVRPVVAPAVDLLGGHDDSIERAWAKARAQVSRQITELSDEVGATVSGGEHLSPDCAAGKHPASWRDMAWDDVADVEVPCECSCHTAGAAA